MNLTGIGLYDDAKHSIVTALGIILSPEQIQSGGTGHVSDVFKRYKLPDINEEVTATKAIQQIQPDDDKLF